MADPNLPANFSRTHAVFERGRQAHWHTGAQIYVSRRGQTMVDLALGEAQPDVAMQSNTLNCWFSAGKPLTAIAIAQLADQRRLALDDPVSAFIPEFAQHGKEGISLRHLLAHTAGFRTADQVSNSPDWDQAVAQIVQAPLEPGWVPGQKAGYQLFSSWIILGEIVRRLDGRRVDQYVREEILEPLQMLDSWLSVAPERFRAYGDRIGQMQVFTRAELKLAPLWNSEASWGTCRPGSSARGPIRELGKFYEALLGAIATGRSAIPNLGPAMIAEFTRPQRVGLFDQTFQHTMDWGLGFIVNSSRYGVETVPYGFGRHASEKTFGHGGSQSSCAFADPAHELVITWICNGMPGEKRHQERARELNSAIYQDLGLS